MENQTLISHIFITSMILPKNTAHFARYLRGIFDNEEKCEE